jgi:hypothetical protein
MPGMAVGGSVVAGAQSVVQLLGVDLCQKCDPFYVAHLPLDYIRSPEQQPDFTVLTRCPSLVGAAAALQAALYLVNLVHWLYSAAHPPRRSRAFIRPVLVTVLAAPSEASLSGTTAAL